MKNDIKYTTRFKKDILLLQKRGYDLTKIKHIINDLSDNNPLNICYRDHILKGNYSGLHECHIEPDWLFVYKLDKTLNVLVCIRTGTHSDLF